MVLVELATDAGYAGNAAAGMLNQGVLALIARGVTVSPVAHQINQHLGLQMQL